MDWGWDGSAAFCKVVREVVLKNEFCAQTLIMRWSQPCKDLGVERFRPREQDSIGSNFGMFIGQKGHCDHSGVRERKGW